MGSTVVSLSSILLLRIAFASLIIPLIQKQIADLPGRVERMWWQFAFASMLVCLVIAVSGESIVHPAFWIVAAFGLPNAMAYYAYLRAINISQSKCAVFSPFVHIISIGLALFLLKEWQFLSWGVCIGIFLSVTGAVLMSSNKTTVTRNLETKTNTGDTKRFWKLVGFYTLVWGLALFLMKLFSEAGMSKYAFIFWWYIGSFFGSTIVKWRVQEDSQPLPIKGITWMLVLASFLVASMLLTYWSYELAPVVMIQPIFQITGVFGTLFIGLFLFRERGIMSRREWAGIGSGGCGAIFIALALT